MFNDEQIDYMRKLGIHLDFKCLSEDDFFQLEEKIADRLQDAGFENDIVTPDGLICESILDSLPN